MYRRITLPVRKAGMSHDEFVTHQQDNHTSIVHDIEGIICYQTVLPVDAEASELDDLAELCFDGLDAFHDALGDGGSRDYDPAKGTAREAGTGVDNFLDVERCPRIIGEEIVEKDKTGGDTTNLYRHSAFLVRKDRMSHDEFLDHWASTHVPLAREVPSAVRYARVVPTDPERVEFNGAAGLYFESLDALRASLGHKSSHDYDPDHPGANAPHEDVDNFLSIGGRPRFVGRETVQKDASGG